jgi:hypothetical protein
MGSSSRREAAGPATVSFQRNDAKTQRGFGPSQSPALVLLIPDGCDADESREIRKSYGLEAARHRCVVALKIDWPAAVEDQRRMHWRLQRVS